MKAASKQPASQIGSGGLVTEDAFQEHPGRPRHSRLDKLKQAIALWVPLLPIPPHMRWEFLEDIGALFSWGGEMGPGGLVEALGPLHRGGRMLLIPCNQQLVGLFWWTRKAAWRCPDVQLSGSIVHLVQ